MNIVLLITGIVEILLALGLGVLFIYAAYKAFDKLTPDIEEAKEIKNNNAAVGILMGSIILSIIYLVKDALDSAITVLGNTLRRPDAALSSYLSTAFIMLVHILITGVIGFFGIYIALQLFFRLTTDIDEMQEIRKNNIAVAILMAVVVFSIALILQPGIKTLLDALIPYPEIALDGIGIPR